MNLLKYIAALFLVISGILHVLQLHLNAINDSIIGMAVFGAIFVIVGLLLFVKRRAFLLVAAIASSLGIIIGTVDHFTSATPLPIFWLFFVIDIIVIPICFVLYFRKAA